MSFENKILSAVKEAMKMFQDEHEKRIAAENKLKKVVDLINALNTVIQKEEHDDILNQSVMEEIVNNMQEKFQLQTQLKQKYLKECYNIQKEEPRQEYKKIINTLNYAYPFQEQNKYAKSKFTVLRSRKPLHRRCYSHKRATEGSETWE